MNEEIIINVWNVRAAVSRRRDEPGGAWSYEPAQNWEALEADATEAVEGAGGWITMSGLYPCPPDLAARAVWGEV